MSQKFLNRDDAPFGAEVWAAIDGAVINAAKSQLTARKMLHVDGPYGLGMKLLPGADETFEEKSSEGAVISASAAIPIVSIESGFVLGARDIAAFEGSGAPMDLSAACQAAMACARKEDELILKGSKALQLEGLLNAKGAQSVKLQNWDEPGRAADDIIKAVTVLDAAGFHGPSILALAPDRFNLLFRRYEQGNMTEMDHLRAIASEGVVKAPAITSGGALITSGRQYASIVLGQDLMAGFVGPAGGAYEFMLTESVALKLLQPEAVCVLQ